MAITLRNSNWENGINVEVRVASHGNPSDVPFFPFGSRKIAHLDSWVIDNDPKFLFALYEYRRDSDPDNPDGTFTEWIRIVHTIFGRDKEVIL